MNNFDRLSSGYVSVIKARAYGGDIPQGEVGGLYVQIREFLLEDGECSQSERDKLIEARDHLYDIMISQRSVNKKLRLRLAK